MLSIEFFCPLPNGLHARPAWALKEQAAHGAATSVLSTDGLTLTRMPKARWR